MDKKNRKIAHARVTYDGQNSKLMVTFEGDKNEHCVYVDSYPYVLCHLDLDDLEYEEDLEWALPKEDDLWD